MDKRRKPDTDSDTYGYRDLYKDGNAFIYSYINRYADKDAYERAADSHIYKHNTIGDLYACCAYSYVYCSNTVRDLYAGNSVGNEHFDKYRYADKHPDNTAYRD
jgi:hypothetical protein